MKFLILPLLSVAFLLAACSKSDPVAEGPQGGPPDFGLTDTDGNAFQLSSTEGKVVLLTFFATWCGSCRSEAPVLGELYTKYQSQGFDIVAVAVSSSVAQAKAFAEEFSVPYRIIMDDGVVAPRRYNITRVPTNFLISRDVSLKGPYGPLSKQQFEKLIEEMLSR